MRRWGVGGILLACLGIAGCGSGPVHAVGTCLKSGDGGGFPWLASRVSCDAVHHFEVFATWRPEDPESGDVDDRVREHCRTAFAGYVGVDRTESSLAIVTWLASYRDLDHTDGSALCLLYQPGVGDSFDTPAPKPMTGTAKDSRR
ncbi:MAG: septum formation family protein [Propioniciclava sp.]